MMKIVFEQFKYLKIDFWGALYHWQNTRFLWLLGACIALILELLAVYFFQGFLKLNPCEKCVYIRFSVLMIFWGMTVVAINPKNAVLKYFGYILISWAIIQGLLWSIELNNIYIEVEKTSISPCLFTIVRFPLGMPLDEWFPAIFMPTGLCGEETWRLFNLNIAQYMIFIYFIYTVLLVLFLSANLIKFIKCKMKQSI